MKMILFLLLFLTLTAQLMAQSHSPERSPTTEEEMFYDGDQVNEDAFSSDSNPSFIEEEESLNPEEEEIIYPYETIDLNEDDYGEI